MKTPIARIESQMTQPTIETIGGAKPKSFEAFVREGQSELLAKAS